jgi:hypothetical protein
LESNTTCRLLGPFRCQKSLRLFLEDDTISGEELVPDLQTGISIGMIESLAYGTLAQWSTHLITLGLFSLMVACNQRSTFRTSTAGISGIYPTGENTSIVGFILCVVEDTPFHPEGSFAIASLAVLALLWFEIAKVLKYQD